MYATLLEAVENKTSKILEFQIIVDDYHYYLYYGKRLLVKMQRSTSKITYSAITRSRRRQYAMVSFINAVIEYNHHLFIQSFTGE
jgi:uncharacterized protein (DUF1499 family)